MASLTTSYLRPDEMDPFGNPRRAPFAAPPMPPDGGATAGPEELPPKPPIAGAMTPAELAPKFQADMQSMNAPAKAPSIYDDPQFADYMAEQAGPKPDKTARVLDAIFSGLAGQQYNGQYWDAKDQAAQQEQLKNAQSPQSQALRQAHAPMLRQLGLQDDEIAHLSGADIAQMTKGGNLVEGLLRARQTAAQAKAAEAKLAEQRAYAEEQDRIKHERERTEKEADLAKQHEYEAGPKFERQMEIARTQGGLASGRQVQGLLLGDELARRRAEEEEQRRIEREKREDERKGKPNPETYSLPGTVVTDPQRHKQTIADDVQRRKLEDSVGAYRSMQEGFERMKELRKKHGMVLTDTGVKSEYEGARTLVISALSTLAQTGVINQTEFERYKSNLDDITPTGKDLLKFVPGNKGDPTLKSLEGFESSVLGSANRKLETMGGVRLASPLDSEIDAALSKKGAK